MNRDSDRQLRRAGFRRTLLRTVAVGVAGVLILIAALWVRAEAMITRKYAVGSASIIIPTDSASIARGHHIATAIGSCTLCHGADMAGAIYMDAGPVGMAVGPNLTTGTGGIAARFTDEDWVRAIRYGVRHDSTSLFVMPSEVFVHLSDDDLGALIAYLKNLPAVDRELPASRMRWLGKLLMGAGRMNLLVASKTNPPAARQRIEAAVTPEYGRYLAEVSGCAGCHGHGYSGGPVAGPPGLPPASNLTPAGPMAAWSESEFVQAMREGIRPDGSTIDEFMPWRVLGGMSDDELRAIRLYLRSLPARETGNK